MQVCLARIDDRLVHGQVATVWSKSLNVQRILVISDGVVNNPIRKALLQQAAPPNVKVNVMTVEKFISIYNDSRLFDLRVLLLFTNPQEVVEIVQAGIYLPSINIGGMSFKVGKQMITNAVAIDAADIEAFRILDNLGIELEIRKVTSDTKQDFMTVLHKSKLTF